MGRLGSVDNGARRGAAVVGATAGAMLRADVWGCLRCVIVFALLLLAPGHCVAWAGDVAGFRRQGTIGQLLWSVAVSFAVVPIVAVMVAKYWSMNVVLSMAIACGVVAAGLNIVAIKRDNDFRLRWERVFAMAGAVGWVLFVVGELVDVGVGSRLYMSVTLFDHALRTAFVDAVMRGGVPPANPLYWPGHAAPMRYYYFWYVVTAAAAKLAGATARQAMIASVVWSGFGLAAVVALYCRHFLGGDSSGGDFFLRRGRRWPRIAIALALLGVTGLDLLPALAKATMRLPTDADMDWWSPDQVGSWMDTLLWVPHHVAGLVCCLLGFLLVWMSKAESGWKRWVCGMVAGVSFASAFGLSIWMAVAFAMVMVAWLVWALGWEVKSRARVPVLLVAGVVAVVALLPYLAELSRAPSGVSTAQAHVASESNPAAHAVANDAGQSIRNSDARLLRFGVRHMIDPDAMLAVSGFAGLARTHPRTEDALAGLILLLPGYFLEFGFFGWAAVVAIAAARRGLLSEAERTALALVVAGLAVSSLLRSAVVANNDFGIRSILIVQFFLLLLAVRWCEGGFGEAGRNWRIAANAMLCLGLAGTIYQAVGLRMYLPMEERLERPAVSGLSEEAMALRRGFAEMDGSVPKSAVVQFNTAQPSDYFRFAQIMQARRQIGVALPDCPAAFGGEADRCGAIEGAVTEVFSPGAVAVGAQGVCAGLGVDYLVATRWDEVWGDRQGWVWGLPAVVDTGDVRVVQCGP